MSGLLSSVGDMFANKNKHKYKEKSDLERLSPEDIVNTVHPSEIGFYIQRTRGDLSKEQQAALNFVLSLKDSIRTVPDSEKKAYIQKIRERQRETMERQERDKRDVEKLLSETKEEVDFERIEREQEEKLSANREKLLNSRLQELLRGGRGKGKTVSKRNQRVKTRKLKKSKKPKKHKRRV